MANNVITLKDVPVSIYSGDDRFAPQGTKAKRRTLFVTLKDLDAVKNLDSSLFAIKISQSKNPDRAGKPMFKHFQYRSNPNENWSSNAVPGSSPASNLDEIKQTMVDQLSKFPDAEFELNFNMPGKWGNIETSDGAYALFDNDHFPDTLGDPNYYLKQGTIATVKLTEAQNMGNQYYQIELSTDSKPEDIFATRGRGNMKYFGEDNSSATEAGSAAADSDWI